MIQIDSVLLQMVNIFKFVLFLKLNMLAYIKDGFIKISNKLTKPVFDETDFFLMKNRCFEEMSGFKKNIFFMTNFFLGFSLIHISIL